MAVDFKLPLGLLWTVSWHLTGWPDRDGVPEDLIFQNDVCSPKFFDSQRAWILAVEFSFSGDLRISQQVSSPRREQVIDGHWLLVLEIRRLDKTFFTKRLQLFAMVLSFSCDFRVFHVTFIFPDELRGLLRVLVSSTRANYWWWFIDPRKRAIMWFLKHDLNFRRRPWASQASFKAPPTFHCAFRVSHATHEFSLRLLIFPVSSEYPCEFRISLRPPNIPVSFESTCEFLIYLWVSRSPMRASYWWLWVIDPRKPAIMWFFKTI